MELSKINHLTNLFRDYDKNNRTYSFDIHFTTPSTGEELNEKVHRGTGAESFVQHIDDLLEKYGADTIKVTTYKGNSPNAHQLNPPVVITLRSGNKQIVVTPVVTAKNANQTGFLGFAGLEGLEGLEKYLNMKENELMKDIEIKTLSLDKDRIESENKELKQRCSELENENDELADENEQLLDEVTKLKKYVPKGNFKIMGFDGIELGGALLSKGLTNILKKNPEGAARFLGVEKETLMGFLTDDEETKETKVGQIQESSVEVEESTENMTQEQRAAKDLYKWLKELPSEDLKKVVRLLLPISSDVKLVDVALKAIEKTKQE